MIEVRAVFRGGTPGTPGLPQRAYNQMRRDALIEVEAYFRREILPNHFTVAGARKYGYTPRSGEGKTGGAFWKSYTGKKQKKKGHQRPLVWSGKSEELSKRRSYTVSATRAKATLRIKILAPALNFRNPFSDIDMRKEITTVTPDEISAMEMVYRNALERLLRSSRDMTPRVITWRDGGATRSSFSGSMSA